MNPSFKQNRCYSTNKLQPENLYTLLFTDKFGSAGSLILKCLDVESIISCSESFPYWKSVVKTEIFLKKIKNLKAVDAVKNGKKLTTKYLLSTQIPKKYSGITRSVKYLYELSERHNWHRNTLLHIATYLEQNDIVKTILEIADIYLHNHTTAICNVRNRFKETPLHLSRNLEVVKLLIEKGANINMKDKSKK